MVIKGKRKRVRKRLNTKKKNIRDKRSKKILNTHTTHQTFITSIIPNTYGKNKAHRLTFHTIPNHSIILS